MKKIPYSYAYFFLIFLAAPGSFAQSELEAVPGEYIIKFKDRAGDVLSARTKLHGKATFKTSFASQGVYHVQMRSVASEKITVSDLKNDPDVEYIEPNYILNKAEVDDANAVSMSYADAVTAASYQASTSPNVYAQSSAETGVAESWPTLTPLSSSNKKIVVAVIDSGLDRNHKVFQPYNLGGTGSLWVNEKEANGLPGVDDDQNGFVDDVNGWNFINNSNNFADDDSHGTHVAGIVVGTGQNIFATSLQESKIQVMPLRFLAAGVGGSTSNAIRAIYYAVDNGAKVINNSWGGSAYSRALHDALIYAYDHRVLVISAAGNYSANNDAEPMYPANYDVPSNLTVASTSSLDKLSTFSNYGARLVHVGSPGERIESTVPGNSVKQMSGTSMAAPFVAGLAALALREAPTLSGFQVKELILSSAVGAGSLSGKVNSGARVQADSLINTSKQMGLVTTAQPFYKPSYLADRSIASDAGGGAGGCGLVREVVKNGPGPGQGSPGFLGLIAGLMLVPIILIQVLRARTSNPRDQRRYERFKMNSQVSLNVGGRELVGSVSTISEGGLSFNADAALEKGGIVTMRIQSPDGNEVIEVQGQVVWSEANQSYGVQFANAKQGTLAMIRDWTSGLMKT